jgi:3'-phosphoadenosine 5'-phosphosulfate sulfotransferase (PAPS reductase)/FAD synthetase
MKIIEEHEKVVLQFSGGKDSLACLLLTKPWWDKITVMWTNTGDAFPETIEQMATIKAMVPHFLEVKTDQPRQISEHGWPSDVISVKATEFGHILTQDDDMSEYGPWVYSDQTQPVIYPSASVRAPVIQGYPLCCGANIWNPMFEATLRLGATLVLRGTRQDDARRATKSQTEVIAGVTFHHPVWDWSARAVLIYVETKGFLPRHYRSTETSLDCMHCTAYLHENAKKMRYLAWMHPEVSIEVQRRLKAIRDIVVSDLAHIERAVI